MPFRGPFGALCRELAPVARRQGLGAFLVGGSVRDLVEGRDFTGEWDVVVFGKGDQGARAAAEEIARAWGWREPVSFPRFGTHLVVGPDGRIEFSQALLRTNLRSLSPDPLTSDALARDFTINSLYIDLLATENPSVSRHPEKVSEQIGKVEVLDPCGRGLEDLDAGLLRTPIDPVSIFEDDPLRIFRAARLRSTHGYRIVPALGRGARRVSARIPDVAPERIRDEMNRILLSERPSAGLQVLGNWGAYEAAMPEVHGMIGFRQDTPYHYPDLFRHCLRTVDRSRCDLAVRWAALLHDCGKPATRVPSEEGDNYYGHDLVGAQLAGQLLHRLRAGRRLTAEVVDLVRLHMVHYTDEWSDRAVRRFIRRSGPLLDGVLDLVEADSASLRLRSGKLRDLGRLRKRVDRLKERTPPAVSPLDGGEIMEVLDIGPGEDVGRAKEILVEAVVEGDIPPEKTQARSYLIRKWKEGGGRFP